MQYIFLPLGLGESMLLPFYLPEESSDGHVGHFGLTIPPHAASPGQVPWPVLLQGVRVVDLRAGPNRRPTPLLIARARNLTDTALLGPIVRIGPNAVSINTVSALREIYGNRRANVRKSDWYRTIDASSGAFSTHSEIDRTKHAFRRRILDHAFSDAALRSAEAFIVENVRTWCRLLAHGGGKHGEWSETKNISEWSTYLNYDIMGDLVFGKKFNCMESEEHRFVPELMMSATAFVYSLAYLPFAALLRPVLASPLVSMIGGQMARDEVAYVKYAKTQMADRKAIEEMFKTMGKENPRKDFLSYLLHAKDPLTGEGFGKEELDADASLLIAAGADTTSVTLSAAFFYLLHNASVLEKLTAEVRAAFADVEEIRGGAKLNGLVYMKACIDEALRLAPPVPTHLPRQVLHGGIRIDGEFFPEGTVVGTSAYCIGHREEYYPRAWEFRPERWILTENGGEGSKESIRTAKDAFCAFSLGTWGCAGRSVAYLELMLELTRCLWLFDVKEAEQGGSGGVPGSVESRRREGRWGRHRQDEFQLVDRFLVERDGPVVQFRARVA